MNLCRYSNFSLKFNLKVFRKLRYILTHDTIIVAFPYIHNIGMFTHTHAHLRRFSKQSHVIRSDCQGRTWKIRRVTKLMRNAQLMRKIALVTIRRRVSQDFCISRTNSIDFRLYNIWIYVYRDTCANIYMCVIVYILDYASKRL